MQAGKFTRLGLVVTLCLWKSNTGSEVQHVAMRISVLREVFPTKARRKCEIHVYI